MYIYLFLLFPTRNGLANLIVRTAPYHRQACFSRSERAEILQQELRAIFGELRVVVRVGVKTFLKQPSPARTYISSTGNINCQRGLRYADPKRPPVRMSSLFHPHLCTHITIRNFDEFPLSRIKIFLKYL